ncbi:MAG TPA: ABC transporter ATP-binding protein, partial [Chloroflexota bacterium]|nr:ABC transporter ATP-binding protein [Chloroflexota bacterium]
TLSIRNVEKRVTLGRDTINILRGVSFDLERGEVVALMGPSGSGKSTLLGIVSGLDRPTAGEVILDGEEIGNLPERSLAVTRARKVGMVFQSFNLIPTLTALENVQLPLHVPGRGNHDLHRAEQLLVDVGLGHRLNHRPSQLSGGEQQRVAVARALVVDPPLLVADEPTGNLDSDTGRALIDLLLDMRAKLGTTILVATHNDSVSARADRALHLRDGRLVVA